MPKPAAGSTIILLLLRIDARADKEGFLIIFDQRLDSTRTEPIGVVVTRTAANALVCVALGCVFAVLLFPLYAVFYAINGLVLGMDCRESLCCRWMLSK